MITIHDDPAVLRVDDYGAIRMGQTNVLFDLVVQYHLRGETPAEMVEAFPTLKLPDVYAAIAYYLRHTVEVDAYLDERKRVGDMWTARSNADPRNQSLRRKIEKLRRERDAAVRG